MTAQKSALLSHILSALDDYKAENIITIDVKDKTSITDYMVVANGRSSRQVKSIAELVIDNVKKHGFASISVTGLDNGEWALVDFGDVILHVFQPDARAFYDIEALWK